MTTNVSRHSNGAERRAASLERGLAELLAWVEERDYTGYDLYDGLNVTRLPAVLNHRIANPAITQFFKRSPINVRPLLGMPKTKMPKGVGLFLNAYALLAAQARREGEAAREAAYLQRCDVLFEWLRQNTCVGYAGYAWNFGFQYKFLFDKPTIVITAAVARGLFAYYQLTGRADVLEVLRSVCDFVLEDLLITETDYGLCFSYTPKDNATRPKLLNCCYNASMLGAEVLASVYAVTGEPVLREYAEQAASFTVEHQHEDGRWNYSIDLDTGRERAQVDFHQGFILDALHACITYAGLDDPRYVKALTHGARFYRREQFTDEGRALWRLPRTWPADIHCQAQGILTFSKLRHLDEDYPPFAETVANWTIQHMQGKEGCFYYRKGRYFTNKIPYMRWGQGWMMLALAELLSRPAPQQATARVEPSVAHHRSSIRS